MFASSCSNTVSKFLLQRKPNLFSDKKEFLATPESRTLDYAVMFEALLICLTLDKTPQLFDWVETLTEAYFRQQTVFKTTKSGGSEDAAYTTQVLEELRKKIDSEFSQAQRALRICGTLD